MIGVSRPFTVGDSKRAPAPRAAPARRDERPAARAACACSRTRASTSPRSRRQEATGRWLSSSCGWPVRSRCAACGDIASSASPGGLARRACSGCEHRRGGGQPRDRLAPARHRRTPRRRRRSASSARPARRSRDVRVVGSRQRRARRPPRGLLDRHRRELPALAPVRGRRAGDGAARSSRAAPALRARAASTSFTVAPPGERSARKSSPTTRATRATIQHYLSAPTLTPSTVHITTAGPARREPRRPVPRALPGRGHAGADDLEQNGKLVWFHPLPAGESSRPTSRSSSTRASRS